MHPCGVEVEQLVGHVDEDAREAHVADVLHHEVEQRRQGLFVAASEGGPERDYDWLSE